MTTAPRTCADGTSEVAPTPSVVTIGNFDGVHRGHQILLRRAVETADARQVRSVAVTFDPHPAAVVRPDAAPLLLQPIEQRCDRLAEAGVDLVLVLPFTRELASLSPEAFIAEVLVEPLQAVRVIVGTNFRFGHRAQGDVVTLVEQGEHHGFEVEAVTLLELDGVPISSSAVRDHLRAGDVAWTARALGRPHQLHGTVVPGDARGRTIGFPTANLDVPVQRVVPADGVYAGRVHIDDEHYLGVVNIGVRPTFAGEQRRIEVHLLDAEVDLYGRELDVTLEHRIRGEQRFAGVAELVAQIDLDVARARELLG